MYARFFSELPVEFERAADVVRGDPLGWVPGAVRHRGAIEVPVPAGGPLPASVSKRVRLTVGEAEVEDARLRISVYWEATGAGFLFPKMDGELELSRWDSDRTLLCLQVDYTPPMGKAGRILDEKVLHGLALSTLSSFRDGIAAALSMPGAAAVPAPEAGPGPGAPVPTVAEIMTREVVSLEAGQSVDEAAAVLRDNGVSGAPVVEGLEVIGFLSESDVVRALAPDGAAPVAATPSGNRSVAEVMSRDVVTIRPEASAWLAARLLDRHGFKALPVTGALGRLEGVVARADLVRLLAGYAPSPSGNRE